MDGVSNWYFPFGDSIQLTVQYYTAYFRYITDFQLGENILHPCLTSNVFVLQPDMLLYFLFPQTAYEKDSLF